MRITFGCGHARDYGDDLKDRPVCRACGDRRIADVRAGAPRITGHATGPHVTPRVLGPMVVSVAERALPLKPLEKGQ